MMRSIFLAIAARRIAKEIEATAGPAPINFRVPAPTMSYGQDFWHLLSWRQFPRMRRSDSAIDRIADIVIQEPVGVVRFPITRLDGLVANTRSYSSARDFALKNFRHDYEGDRRIEFMTDADFQDNIANFRGHIRQPAPMVWCEWSDRFYLQNPGSGHHTAAILRQCLDQGREFWFDAEIKSERLAPEIIEELRAYHFVLCETGVALQLFAWSSALDQSRAWLSIGWPDGHPRWNSPELSLIAIDRWSRLYPSALRWLGRSSDTYLDVSKLMDEYRPRQMRIESR